MDRLLHGELPPGRKPDIKSLASEAGVSRQLFYSRDKGLSPGLYQHLAQEFERRLATQRLTEETADPRVAQIERLKTAQTELRKRLNEREAEVAELKLFQQRAGSQIAAQQAEIERLRREAGARTVRQLPARRAGGR